LYFIEPSSAACSTGVVLYTGAGQEMIDKALKIDGWMAPEELQWLAEQAQKHHTIVEIGSFRGRSTRALADNTPGVVYAVDHWYGPMEFMLAPWEREALFDEFLANMNGLIESKKVVPVRCNSMTVEIDAKPDMVFIDGDHSFESVVVDIEKWKGIDGLLCGHDFSFETVREALAKFFNENEIVQVENTDIWMRL